MKLLITKDIPDDIVELISTELNIVEEPSVAFHKSESAPSFIQLMGEIIQWLSPLKIAATAFLLELSKEMAKDLYKNKAKIAIALKNVSVDALRKVSELISIVKTRLSERTSFLISIPMPDDYFGTILHLESKNIEDIAWSLSNFITRMESISDFIQEIQGNDLSPLAPLFVKVLDDGSVKLEWMDKNKLEKHEKIF